MSTASDPDAGGAHEAITVALIEDQQVLSGAIQRSLATLPDVRVVGTATSLAEGVALVEASTPDVLVSDFRLADGDIPDRLAEMQERSPDTRVLVFTGWPDEGTFLESMAAGAVGFLDKAAPFDEFIDAIRRVANGEVVVAPRFLPALTRRATSQKDATALSRRELEVLQLLAEGLTNQQVGARLGLSARTVKTHVQNLLVKLDVPDRTGAVARAFRLGLIR